jgi:transposase
MTGQTEDSEEITVVERRFVMLHHLRKKYRCACNGCVETAPGPLRLTTQPDRRGRRYSADFAVEVAIGKYLDHRVPRMRPETPRGRKGSNAAGEMRAGPSESGCRTRLQTASRCAGQEPGW